MIRPSLRKESRNLERMRSMELNPIEVPDSGEFQRIRTNGRL